MIVNQIQGGRWDTFLRRLFPIKDRSVAPVMASELVGQVMVQEWSTELYKLRGDNLAVALASRSAVAAEFAHVNIRNPNDSGNLVIIEQIWVATSSNMLISMAREGTSLVVGFSPVATSFRDSRSGTATAIGETVATVNTLSDAAGLGGTGVAVFPVLATTLTQLDFPLVLAPGSGLILRGNTVNITLRCCFIWRERVAEPSELIF